MSTATGAMLTSLTVTVISSSSHRTGSPLSQTLTVKVNSPGPCASVGVQVNAPVAGLMLAPSGAPTRLKVRVLAGKSASVAVAVKLSAVSSATVLSPIAPRTGATLTSPIVTVIVSHTVNVPSLTQTSNVYVPGPCASVGVQVNAPVAGSMLAPVGAPTRLKVRVLAGRSASVAVAVKLNCTSSATLLSPIAPRTGATLTSVTVTVMLSSSHNIGVPLSQTFTVKV